MRLDGHLCGETGYDLDIIGMRFPPQLHKVSVPTCPVPLHPDRVNAMLGLPGTTGAGLVSKFTAIATQMALPDGEEIPAVVPDPPPWYPTPAQPDGVTSFSRDNIVTAIEKFVKRLCDLRQLTLSQVHRARICIQFTVTAYSTSDSQTPPYTGWVYICSGNAHAGKVPLRLSLVHYRPV